MKEESLVIVDQHATVNLYLGLVLPARHAPEIEWIRSHINFLFFFLLFHAHVVKSFPRFTSGEKREKGKKEGQGGQELLGNWSEVVTR